MDCLFHGCYYKNVDDTNKLIFPGEKCLLSMNRCFWKHPDDVISRIKTRSARKNEPSVGWRVITKYYGDKQKRRESNEF